jgi:hypothetical protein
MLNTIYGEHNFQKEKKNSLKPKITIFMMGMAIVTFNLPFLLPYCGRIILSIFHGQSKSEK